MKRLVMAMGLFALVAGMVVAADAGATPEQIRKLMSSAGRDLVTNPQKAEEALAQAKALYESIKDEPAAKAIGPQLEALQQRLDKRLGRSAPGSPAAPQKPAAAATPTAVPAGAAGAVKTSAGAAIPQAVKSRLDKATKALDRADEEMTRDSVASTDYRAKKAAASIDEAEGFVQEALKGYGDKVPASHPAMKTLTDRIAAQRGKLKAWEGGKLADEAAAKATATASASASDAWMLKLNPYADFYGAKRLLTEPTDVPANLVGQREFHREAQAVLAESRKASIPGGKSEALTELETKLAAMIDAFPKHHDESIARQAAAIGVHIDRGLEQMADTSWKADPKKLPPLLHPDQLKNATQSVETLASAVGTSDARVTALQAKVRTLESQAAANRGARVEATRMQADRFSGAEAKAVKTQAGAVVTKKFPDARILRTTVISAAWKEENVVEWTDSTKSAVRRRITRSLTAQVAAMRGSEVMLHTIDISSDKDSSGVWGALRGHIMFSDKMLEANVNH